MVKAVKGVVIECDTSVKEIILGLNQQGNFILEDLDETHVFVDASCVEQLRVDIDQILNENTYNVEEANK
ncbi:TFIIH complex subunit tfb5 [Actinomortierella ambigua]|nr:TFIIH complex subunit tfb5 [Actinomortierella ambigua]